MRRRWILQLGPWVIPTDAREELAELHVRCSPEQYINAVWDSRYAYPSVRSSEKGWPIGREDAAQQNNVVEWKRP